MKQRLMATQAGSKVSSRVGNNEFQAHFKNLIEDLEVLFPKNRSDNINIQYGDEIFGVYHKRFKLIKFYLFGVFVSTKKKKKFTLILNL